MTGNEDLFQLCKKGDAKAQRILYDSFKNRLMGLCRRYARHREDAQDILQETFIRIFTKIHQLESPEKFESWMKAIGVHEAIKHYHRTKARNLVFSEMPDDKEDVDVSDLRIENVTDEYLVSLVNELPDGCRVVFNLFAVEGYTHGEIAEMLQVSEGTSRSQLYHAKFLLKKKLKSRSMAHYYEKFA
jgi:RNA polymerase sigma factor (sigma-70 family)